VSGSVVLVHLVGAVALLLWATRMVRTGVERAYGNVLKRRLRRTLMNPFLAVSTGAALAVSFQSATAVSLLVGSFVGSGIVGSGAGLITVLGADLGSSLVVKLLSFDLSMLVPAALFVGTTIFLATERRAWRQFGRILIGIGLLILSLQFIGEVSKPLRESHVLPVLINYLANDPVIAFLIAAVATWLFHSSVAFILLVAALATQGLVPAELGVVMVLGANLGSGLIAALLSRTMPTPSRTVPFGNLLVRGVGAVLALAVLVWFHPPLEMLGSTATLQIVHAHIVFNVALVILGLPLATLVTRTIERMGAVAGPACLVMQENVEASTLDPGALKTPSRALANVTRAVLSVCDAIEVMLQNIMALYEDPGRARMSALAALDDHVDRKHAEIKYYLAQIPHEEMSEVEAGRACELLDACVKLEQVGDIITRNMLVHVKKKQDRGLTFTSDDWQELSMLHASVLNNARLAFNVLVTRDTATALELVREKDRLRELERDISLRHFRRLQEGIKKSVESSSLHYDTIGDLRQINSLLAFIAYPVLEKQGLMQSTRLVTVE